MAAHDATLGQRLNGAAPMGVRQKDDFYPTPPEGTMALLNVEKFTGLIWEPACGNGAICKVLIESGHEVMASDLVDRGHGIARRDFLLEWNEFVPNIITNPPFKMAVEFARNAIFLASDKVALLVQLRFLEGIERKKLFLDHPPSRVWVFAKRLPMPSGEEDGTKGGMLAFAWFVWDKTHIGPTQLGWI